MELAIEVGLGQVHMPVKVDDAHLPLGASGQGADGGVGDGVIPTQDDAAPPSPGPSGLSLPGIVGNAITAW